MVNEFISQYGFELIATLFTAIAGAIGLAIKNLFNKHLDEKTKKEVAKTVVTGVEQIYKDLTGDERFEKAMETMSEMLTQKGIACTELEMKMLIESAVNEMNTNIKKGAK